MCQPICAKTTVDLFTQSWCPILFSIIVYYCLGYRPVADKFFMFTFLMVLDCFAAISLATMITCLCVSVELSVVVLGVVLEICRLYGGFFVAPSQLDIPSMEPWRFADALSYVKYAFIGVSLNELQGLELSCPAGSTCTYTNGDQIISAKGYDEYTISFCIYILIIYIIGCRTIAYIALKFIKH